MRNIFLLCLLPLVGCATMHPEVAPAGSQREAPAAMRAEKSDNTNCTNAAPEPILEPDAYPGETFAAGDDNRGIETAKLDGNVDLTIETSGCTEGLRHTFTFLVRNPDRRKSDVLYWINFTRGRMAPLKVDSDAAWFMPSILQFLAKAGELPMSRGKITLCNDGTSPVGQDCSLNTGGGVSLALVDAGRDLKIVVDQYDLK